MGSVSETSGAGCLDWPNVSLEGTTLRRRNCYPLVVAREHGMHESAFFRKVEALGVSLPEEDARADRRQGK